MSRLFFDTETTGLKPGQIGQLSYIIENTDNGNINAKNMYFEIEYITEGASSVTGRDIEFYKNISKGQKFQDRAQEIIKDFSDNTLIAHNIQFDESFLSAELWRQNIVFTPKDRFDTMTYFKDIIKLPDPRVRNGNKYKNPKLLELVNWLRLDTEKILEYTKELFNLEQDYEDIASNNKKVSYYHDAAYDTTSMFVAFKVYQDDINSTHSWSDRFRIQRINFI